MQVGCDPAVDDVQLILQYRRLPPLVTGSGKTGSGKGEKGLMIFVIMHKFPCVDLYCKTIEFVCTCKEIFALEDYGPTRSRCYRN
jgi:hypothetical protein